MNSFQTALQIINRAEDTVPMLLEDLLPKTGLAALAGESDVGKSSWLRQLGLNVVLGSTSFLGKKLNTKFKRVLYISTEDNIDSLGPGLKLQVNVMECNEHEELQNYYFLDDKAKVMPALNSLEADGPLDLIIVDSFSDFMTRDINATNEVRRILNQFSHLSRKHNCLVLILHHVRKSANAQSASKNDLLGSTGFEGKMRAVLMLMNGSSSDQKKLRVVKGNYIKPELKNRDIILRFQDLLFERVGETEIDNSDPVEQRNDQAIEIVESLIPKLENGTMIKDLFEKAVNMNYPFGKSKFYEQVKELNKSPYEM